MRPRRQHAGSARGAKAAHKKCEVDQGEVKKPFSLFLFPFHFSSTHRMTHPLSPDQVQM